MRERVADFKTVLGAIEKSGARVVLIGGLAGAVHGVTRGTVDVDYAFARDRKNCQAIVDALAPFHPRPDGFPPDLPYVWDAMTVQSMATLTLETDIGFVDFLSEPAGVEDGFEGLWERSLVVPLFGFDVRVCSREDLKAMKRAAGREKDLLDLSELEAVDRVLSEQEDQDR